MNSGFSGVGNPVKVIVNFAGYLMIVGIDPGIKGAMVTLSPKGKIVDCLVMPNRLEKVVIYLEKMREKHPKITAILEKSSSRPNQSCVAMFNYGCHYGGLLGVLITLRIPHILVSPRTWTAALHKGLPRHLSSPKQKSLMIAKTLYPQEDFLATKRCKVPHTGIVDALLIAEYGRAILRSKPDTAMV